MDVTWWGVPASLLVMSVVELAKQVGFPAKYAGLLAVALGVLGGVAAYLWADSPAASAAVNGLVAGLGAAGLWSSIKNAAENTRKDQE